MSFKNLRPAPTPTSSNKPTKEELAAIPVASDPRKNDEAVDVTPDREGLIEWPPAQFDKDNPAAGGNRPPMKLKP